MKINKAVVLSIAAAAGIGAAVYYFWKDKQDRDALSEEFGDDDFDIGEDTTAANPEGYTRRYVSISGCRKSADDMSDSIKPKDNMY